MKKNNTLLTLALALLLSGCASFGPKYAPDEPQSDFAYPHDKTLKKSFYFIGDAGYAEPGETAPGLSALKHLLDSTDTQGDHMVFLGDNIYPDGMPPENDPTRAQSEYRVDIQLDALENFDGDILFLPGNHDWYNDGLDGLERQANYIKEKLNNNEDVWAPLPGCGFEIRELSDEVVLFIMDSQWYLEDWDRHPTINDDCPEMRSRDAVIDEIDSELGDYPNSTIVFLLHHPIYSNGIHGGQYTLNRHIFPSAEGGIPLPILGSLATLIRTAGGISIQDLQNQRYKKMANRLATLANDNQRLVFVSGHEHSLQYIEHGNIHQIISGAGSKNTYATLGNDGLFAYPGKGFVKYDLFEDQSSWASYYAAIDGKPQLLYQTEVFSAPEKYPIDSLPDVFPQTVSASVYEREEAEKSELYSGIFGGHYRELYMRKIEAQVADLDTLYGGLEVVHAGGGHQTRSIRVEDKDGKQYNMREIKKSALLLLQSSIFKHDNIKDRFRNTMVENMVQDFYTATHPYTFMIIPTLSKAAKIYHTNPEIYYLPKQDNLGRYNKTFGNKLYMIEERPEENWMQTEIWGNPNEDIESTAGLYDRMRRDEKYSLDETAYIRARIFDMLIGDWDRHQDQWRWAEHEDENGDHYFQPIPRDRDQAFSNFDGPFFGTLRGLAGFAKIYGTYGPDIANVKWFNSAGIGMDRTLIEQSGAETWTEQAKYIQKHVTDQVIEEAFSKLPEETQGESAQLIEDLKARRDNLLNITKRYYRFVAKLAIITATDKDDHIEIERLPEGKTKISVSRIKGGEVTDPYIENTFDSDVTKEIWVYALDDDDVIEVHGEGDDRIKVKVIGGQNNDIYKISSGKGIDVYDYKSKPNTYEEIGKADLHITDKYEYNHFDKEKKIFNTNMILPAFGYNPDDGFKLGVQDVFTINGFKRNPFSSQHKFRLGYYFATNGFDFEYDAQFADFVGNYNLAVGAYFTSPNFTRNFFGYGNETPNPEDEISKDYNRIRISRMGVDVGLVKEGAFGSNFKYTTSFHTVQLEDTTNRFLVEEFAPANSDFYDRKYFAGLDATYLYESYDDVLNPTRGMKFKLSVGGKMNVEKTENTYAYLHPYLSFYNALTRNRKWVLKTNVQSQINIGNGYEFYQAANLGADTGLRGYRNERFTGKTAFAAGADLRYSLPEFTTRFLPFQIGVFAGGDVGRVWMSDENSEIWHNDFGGGIWVNSAEVINGTFQMFNGKDGWRFSFLFGFKF